MPNIEQINPGDAIPGRQYRPDNVQLFLYNAALWNAHRIHFDHPYATGVEGYPGLVVHGPMLATLLCAFATELAGQRPRSFAFRSLATLFDDAEIQLHAAPDGRRLRLWAARPEGPAAMEATAAF